MKWVIVAAPLIVVAVVLLASDAEPSKLSPILRDLQSDDELVYFDACARLAYEGDPGLREAFLLLQDEDFDPMLGRWEPLFAAFGKKAARGLAVLLEDDREFVRRRAASGLIGLHRNAVVVLPEILDAIARTDKETADELAIAVRRMGWSARAHVPLLIQHARRARRKPLAWEIFQALGEIGAEARAAVPLLERSPYGPAVTVALARIQPDHPTLPARCRYLYTNSYSNGRDAAAQALAAMGGERARPFLSDLLAHLQFNYEPAVPRALAAIGPPALDRLRKLLRHKDHTVATRAARAIARMGADAAPAIPDLIASMDNLGGHFRDDAIYALGMIGPAAKAIVPRLKKLPESPEALLALARISPDDAVPLVNRHICGKPGMREPACRAAAEIGAPAKNAKSLPLWLGEYWRNKPKTPSRIAIAWAKASVYCEYGPLKELLAKNHVDAARYLASVGQRAPLEKLLRDPDADENQRYRCHVALQRAH